MKEEIKENGKIDMRDAKKVKIKYLASATGKMYVFVENAFYQKMERRPKGGLIEITSNLSTLIETK